MEYKTIFMLNGMEILEFNKDIEYKIGEKVKFHGKEYNIERIRKDFTKGKVRTKYYLENPFLGIHNEFLSNPIDWSRVIAGSKI